MNKSTKKYQFSPKTKKAIWARDNDQCIFCRMNYHMECTSSLMYTLKDCMHVVNKSAGGLGVEENGVTGCRYHHNLLDNGNKGLRDEMLQIMENYLKDLYPDWNRDKLVYDKWDPMKNASLFTTAPRK